MTTEWKASSLAKVAVITGASGGPGVEIVRAFAVTGVALYLTARDIAEAENTLGDIVERDRMHFVQLDHTSLSSVRSVAARILEKTSTTNTGVAILICNVAVMCLVSPRANLAAAAASLDLHSRVVTVAAPGHRVHGLKASDDYSFEEGAYNPWAAYEQTKTANIYTANEIERRKGGRRPRTTRTQVPAMLSDGTILKGWRSPEQGAGMILKRGRGEGGGRYLVDCGEAVHGEDDREVASLTYVSHTYDEEGMGRLWRDSEGMLGIFSIVGDREV
ncbi:hypothetical protein BJY00DRAFT_303435 [Aspergillus carlsbadensis]|nr:hypothetical protein BJY00DRAFT_303435 [Aspergillus carlsbadensis]